MLEGDDADVGGGRHGCRRGPARVSAPRFWGLSDIFLPFLARNVGNLHYLCRPKQWDGLPLAQLVREESPGNTGHSAT